MFFQKKIHRILLRFGVSFILFSRFLLKIFSSRYGFANSMALPKNQNSMDIMGANGGFSSWLWTKFEKHAALALYNPFMVALAAGTLEMKCFENFIAQDLYYLEKYGEAYKLATYCEDNNDDKEDSMASMEQYAENYAQQLRVQARNDGKEYSPNTVTLKYCAFLLATASGKVEGGQGLNPVEKAKIPAYTIASLTPCIRLYSFLGREIFKALESNFDHTYKQFDHPYKQWIELIFPEDNKGSQLPIERVFDRLAKSLTKEELEVLGRLYYHALKLDIEFLSAQSLDQRTLVPLLKNGHSANHRYTIVSDFDLSCTILDSSAVLSEIATLKAKQNVGEKADKSSSSSHIWDEFCSQYSKEYDEWLRKILPSEKVNTFNYQLLYKFVEQLSQIKIEANSKFAEAPVIQGLNMTDIEKAKELKHILMKTNNSNVDMHIISLRWSGDIIKAVFITSGLDGLHIHSNELTECFSTNGIDKHVDTPINKLRLFNNIWSPTKDYDMEHTSIYIGRDNLDDLLCLLKADIGIVIGTSSKLKRVGEYFGVSFIPLFLGLVKQERVYAKCYNGWIRESGIIYTVSSWSEIHAFFLGSFN